MRQEPRVLSKHTDIQYHDTRALVKAGRISPGYMLMNDMLVFPVAGMSILSIAWDCFDFFDFWVRQFLVRGVLAIL